MFSMYCPSLRLTSTVKLWSSSNARAIESVFAGVRRSMTTMTTRHGHAIRPVPIGTYKDKYGRMIQRRVRIFRPSPTSSNTIASSPASNKLSHANAAVELPRFNLLTATHLHVRFPGGIYIQIPRKLPKIPVAGPAIVPQPLQHHSPSKVATAAATSSANSPTTLATPLTHVTSSSSSNIASSAKAMARPIFTWFQENLPTIILNMGSLATLTAFTRSDILELRMLSITGSLSSIVYFATRPPPRIYAPMIWSSIFVLTNAYMLYKIWMERQGSFGTSKISMEELYAYQEFFAPYGVTPRQFGLLLSKAQKTFYPKNSVVLKQNQVCDKVYLVLSGKTEAHVVQSSPTTHTATTTISRRITAAGSVVGNKKTLVGGDAGAWIGEEVFLDEWSVRTSLPPPTLPKKMVRKLKEEVDKEEDEPSSTHNHSTSPNNSKIHTSLLEYCAVEDTVLLEWTHEDLMELLSQGSSDLRAAIPRAMTGAVVGKVVNMYSSSASTPSSSVHVSE